MTGGTFWRIRTKQNADMLHDFLLRQVSDGKDMLLREEETTRTTRQNNALHAVLRRLAKGLNVAGHTVKHPFKPELELPWTENLCKGDPHAANHHGHVRQRLDHEVKQG